MCQGCWEEAGSPSMWSPKIAALAEAAASIDHYGAFHIVVEDWTLEDESLDFCLAEDRLLPPERDWLLGLQALTEPQRYSAMVLSLGFWKHAS